MTARRAARPGICHRARTCCPAAHADRRSPPTPPRRGLAAMPWPLSWRGPSHGDDHEAAAHGSLSLIELG